ncbi:NlpC/P60 family protein [Pseudonocardia aurantiaca]|uniref:NlpC/P60 family protein n=1 Tax=Pseudonocardia aurantiaca TaxID=75290 RepID=A0ABW4FKE9_9PSEU
MRLATRRLVMGAAAVAVGMTGIVVGAVRDHTGSLVAAAVTGPMAQPAASPGPLDAQFFRLHEPARTVVVDAGGMVVATLTDGARTATLEGPERTFAEPQFTAAKVVSRVWVRLLPQPWQSGLERAPWFWQWLEENRASTAPDVLAVATEYFDGAPDGRDAAGVRVRGDAGFGPPGPPGALPRENSDFADYLGVPWTFADGQVRDPEPERYGSVDCSGFVRLVYGYRAGYPLLATNVAGPELPRRAWAMAELGPGVPVVTSEAGEPSDLRTLQPGDLLFFDLDQAPDGRNDHSAIYLGLDDAGQHRFVSSRIRAEGPALGDLGGVSLLDGDGRYARAFRVAKRL